MSAKLFLELSGEHERKVILLTGLHHWREIAVYNKAKKRIHFVNVDRHMIGEARELSTEDLILFYKALFGRIKVLCIKSKREINQKNIKNSLEDLNCCLKLLKILRMIFLSHIDVIW